MKQTSFVSFSRIQLICLRAFSWYGSRASEGEDETEAEEDEERELRLVLDYRDRILHDLEHADTVRSA